jgi:hypothetical protein
MKKTSKEKIAAAVTQAVTVKPEVKEAVETIGTFATLFGNTDYVAFGEMAKKADRDAGKSEGGPVTKAFAIQSEAAEASEISIATFIDALVDMSRREAESVSEIDEDDMPDMSAMEDTADRVAAADPSEMCKCRVGLGLPNWNQCRRESGQNRNCRASTRDVGGNRIAYRENVAEFRAPDRTDGRRYGRYRLRAEFRAHGERPRRQLRTENADFCDITI